MKKLIVYLSLILVSASASAKQSIDGLTINGLQQLVGKYVSVFYVSGHLSTMGIEQPGQKPVISSIMAEPLVLQIPSSGEVIIPVKKVARVGLKITNLVVVVIHEQPQFVIRTGAKKIEDKFLYLQTRVVPIDLGEGRHPQATTIKFDPRDWLK